MSFPSSSIIFSPTNSSVDLETIQFKVVSPDTTWQPFCNSKLKPSLCVLSTHISTPLTESIISSKPSKSKLAKC